MAPTFNYTFDNGMVGFEEWVTGNLIKKASYHFDALGRRVEKIVEDYQDSNNNKTRLYTYHDNEILSVYNEDNMRLVTYTHSLLRTDDPLSMEVTAEGVLAGIAPLAKSYYFFKDGLGSIEAIADEAGNKIQSYVYSSFGKLLKTFNSAGAETTTPELEPHFTYTAREIDVESGLYHYRARAYNPELGRFLQVDPHSGKGLNPLTFINKFTYGGNNPIVHVDPSGKIFTAILLGIAIGAVVGGVTAELTGGDFWRGAFVGAIVGGAGVAGFYAGAGAFASTKVAVSAMLTGTFSAGAATGVGFAAGVIAATLSGAFFGALVGGALGGGLYEASGQGSFREGSRVGAEIGYVSGGISGFAGAFAPTSAAISESTTIGKVFTNIDVITATSIASALVPFGIYEVEADCGKPKPWFFIIGSKRCD